MKILKSNKLFFPLILVLSSLTSLKLNCADVFSRSFFSVRPTFQSSMPEKVSFFRPDLLDACDCGPGSNFQVVAYGGQTTAKGSRELARYFLPQNAANGCIRIKEVNPFASEEVLNNADLDEFKTIDARHLNIETVNQNFDSRVCFNPTQEFFGIGLTFRQRLSKDCDGFTKWWFEASMPIVQVRNNMNLCEEIRNDGGGVATDANGNVAIGLDNSPRVENATQAFRQSNWKFGKIDSRCDMEEWTLADVELKIGWNHIRTTCCAMNSYLGLIVPTSDQPNARYVFEPLGGNNNHFGIMFGGGTYYTWWEKCNHSISVLLDTNYRYLFSNNQMRSIDPIGKQWGRYMEVYRNSDEAVMASELAAVGTEAAVTQASRIGTSGINAFTFCVEVTPQFSTDINTGFQYIYEAPCYNLIAEAGYNFWASQSERIRINDTNFNVALKALQGGGQYTLARTIEDNFSGSNYSIDDYPYQSLRITDLDLESASQPAVLSQILYVTVGCVWNENCPKFISLGGSWEGSSNNASIERWTAWVKYGIAF